jgi:uncharacterized protein (TIGR02145 family)
MKLEKIHHASLLLFSFLSLIACNTIEPYDPVVNKPQPEDSEQINLILDKSLDFKNYLAHTSVDSIGLVNSREKLFRPEGTSSGVIFTDKSSGEIMAFVLVDSAATEVSVNLESITTAVVTFAPMYSALTSKQKTELLQKIKSENSFIQLKSVVGEILSKKEPIFSDRPEFIDRLIDVNSFIKGTYFPGSRLESSRVNLGSEKFPDFVKSTNGITVVNQVFSYIFVSFTPRSGGNPINKSLDPSSLEDLSQGKVTGNELALKDDCYTVEINQTNNDVVQKNTLKLGSILTSSLMEAVIGIGIKGCLPSFTATTATKIGEYLAFSGNISGNKTALQMLTGVTKVVAEELLSVLKSGDCSPIANKFAIARFVASKANLYGNLYTAAKFAQEATYAMPYLIAVTPLRLKPLKEDLQLYEGKLVEACVKVVKGVDLKSEYPEGEQLIVKIRLDTLSQYATWKKSGFKVLWDLRPTDGELSLASSETSSDGTASVVWTLPKVSNVLVILEAKLRDKESDHLIGSPLNFQVKVEPNTITDPRDGNVYKIVKIGNQTWFAENLRYAGNIPQVTSTQAWAAIWNNGNPTGQPAWSYYNNNAAYDALYGKLYNWYAVNTGTLCPPGWHIPTDGEWTILTNFLGGAEVAGGKMKSVTGWDSPNIAATNESGFTGLPGGIREANGFGGLGSNGYWWSSSTDDSNGSWFRTLDGSSGSIGRGDDGSGTDGFSCRCLRD